MHTWPGSAETFKKLATELKSFVCLEFFFSPKKLRTKGLGLNPSIITSGYISGCRDPMTAKALGGELKEEGECRVLHFKVVLNTQY